MNQLQSMRIEECAEQLRNAETILIPKGRAEGVCQRAVEQILEFSIPSFDGRQLAKQQGEQIIRRVRGKDIAAIIGSGEAEIGFLGSDVTTEQVLGTTGLRSVVLDDAAAGITTPEDSLKMCSFDLLTPIEKKDEYLAIVQDSTRAPLQVITSLPRLLERCVASNDLNIKITSGLLTGGIEGAVGWLAPAAADLVESGETARENQLARAIKFADIFPAAVWRESIEN